MKHSRILALLVAAALLLGTVGIVSAQEPQFFSNLTTNMNPVFPGNTPDFTIQGTMSFDTNGGGLGYSCLVIALPNSGTAWGSVTTQSATANGSDISGSMGSWTPDGTATGADCHSVGSIAAAPTNTQWWYVRMPSSGAIFQSVAVTVRATVNGNSGSYTIRAATNDSAFAPIGTWFYIDMTGNPMVQNAAATTRYVANNSLQCQGYSPCDTGPGGLATALADGTATTIVVLGVYNADPQSSPNLTGGDTLRGQGGASVNFQSTLTCTTGAFLTVNGAGGTIQDLTFDGTCTLGTDPSYGVYATAGTLAIQDTTFQDFANEAMRVDGGTLDNTDVTYDNNGTGASVTAGSGTFDSDAFTDNTTGLAISGGAGTATNSTFDGNTTGVSHTAGTASIGTAPGNGNTFTDNTIGILSDGGTIKDNAITGGTTGISMTAASNYVYANTVSGASGNQIECGGSFAAAGYNYIGGNYNGGGTNCTDGTDQLGSEIVAWTDGTSLNECSLTSGNGPIFDLGNNSPYGLTPPQGRDSKYYATTAAAGTVTTTVGTTQFKMHMDRTDTGSGGTDVCNPMTGECWESAPDRGQTGSGYYFGGSQDPTALTLANVTAESPNLWLPVAMAVVVLAGVGGALLLLRRRRTM
jgi:hypothetical protein